MNMFLDRYPSEDDSGLYDRELTIQERCSEILANTLRDAEKMKLRIKHLSEHPEERINIDTAKLRKIIDYEIFLCHPHCSIAENRAIKGSDVDRGLVISKEVVSEEDMKRFIEELRDQGFNVTMNSGEDLGTSKDITFLTMAQIEELKKKPLNYHIVTYYGGYRI